MDISLVEAVSTPSPCDPSQPSCPPEGQSSLSWVLLWGGTMLLGWQEGEPPSQRQAENRLALLLVLSNHWAYAYPKSCAH